MRESALKTRGNPYWHRPAHTHEHTLTLTYSNVYTHTQVMARVARSLYLYIGHLKLQIKKRARIKWPPLDVYLRMNNTTLHLHTNTNTHTRGVYLWSESLAQTSTSTYRQRPHFRTCFGGYQPVNMQMNWCCARCWFLANNAMTATANADADATLLSSTRRRPQQPSGAVCVCVWHQAATTHPPNSSHKDVQMCVFMHVCVCERARLSAAAAVCDNGQNRGRGPEWDVNIRPIWPACVCAACDRKW